MSISLETYQSRHFKIAHSEKVGNARNMLKLTKHIAPRWTEAIEGIYRYVRIIDDAVDESDYIQPIKQLLEEEKQAFQDSSYSTNLQQEYLDDIMKNYFKDNRIIVKQNLYRILQGLSLDLKIRDTQQPFTNKQLLARNFLDIWPCFAIFSVGTTNIIPKPTKDVVKLLDSYATYDNISDTPEDLSHGLNLIPKEDLEKYNLQFFDGQTLPNNQLIQYHRQKGKLITPILRKYSSAFFQTGMPNWLAALSYCYFYSRSWKLLIPLSIQQNLTYQIPKDAHYV